MNVLTKFGVVSLLACATFASSAQAGVGIQSAIGTYQWAIEPTNITVNCDADYCRMPSLKDHPNASLRAEISVASANGTCRRPTHERPKVIIRVTEHCKDGQQVIQDRDNRPLMHAETVQYDDSDNTVTVQTTCKDLGYTESGDLSLAGYAKILSLLASQPGHNMFAFHCVK